MTAPPRPRSAVDAVNHADPRRLRAALTACADVPDWVAGLVRSRPYADERDLLQAADAGARCWTDEQVERALAQHPRIGERSTSGGREAAMSAREQSGVGAERDLAQRLREGNERYEQRFGRVFLIRASGRTGTEVLAALEQRLAADDETERATVRDELRQIALLRLEGLLVEAARTGELP